MTTTPPQASARSGDLTARIVSSIVLAPIVLGAVWYGGWALAILAAAAGAILMYEWLTVTGRDPRSYFGAAAIAAVVVGILAAGEPPLIPVGIAIVAIAAIILLAITRDIWLGIGTIYAAVMAISLLAIRADLLYGLIAVVFVLAIVWATDIAAYAAGRIIGGPKLWPAVSPKKTWAGAIGGLVAAVIAGLLVAAVAGERPSLAIALIALVLSIACQAGDLFESAVKRRFGVKDASRLIPGHGGLLDRVDGLTFAAPLAALIGILHAGAEQIGEGLLSW
jgi:phosphatidate cytidylyltransferase